MDGLRAGLPGSVQDSPLVEIALRRRPRPDEIRLVGGGDVQRGAVGLGVDRDGADPELPQGAEDADGDLAAIGDEHLGEGGHDRPILAGLGASYRFPNVTARSARRIGQCDV
jgi:hypothetical protein